MVYRRVYAAVVAAALLAIASPFVAISAHSQSFTGRDPDTGELLAPGAAVGQYLQASEELRLRIQILREQLDRCGNCDDRTALEQDLDAAVAQQNTIKEGEGIVLKTLHLPGKDFGDFVNELRGFGIPERPPEALEFDAQLDRTVINYCLITSKTDAEDHDCKKKYYHDYQTRDDAAQAVKICYLQFRLTDRERLHNFPPPDADPKIIAAHKALWFQFESCVKQKNAYEMMRIATNEACSFKDVSANMNEDDFVCACEGFSIERRAACPANPVLPPPVVPTFDFQDEPVVRMLAPDGYGPTYMGVRLGLPLADADREIRSRMKVASVYDLKMGIHLFFGGQVYQLNGDRWPFEYGGRLYVNGDGSEFVVIMIAANLPGRVFELEHTALVPVDQESADDAALVDDMGEPSLRGFNGFERLEAWGITKEHASVCMPMFVGLQKKQWSHIDGEAEVASKASTNLGWAEEPGLYGHLTPLLKTNPGTSSELMYKCGPVLQALYEDTGYRDGNKQIDWKGVPVLETVRMFDPSLLRWYEIQQDYKQSSIKGVPLP